MLMPNRPTKNLGLLAGPNPPILSFLLPGAFAPPSKANQLPSLGRQDARIRQCHTPKLRTSPAIAKQSSLVAQKEPSSSLREPWTSSLQAPSTSAGSRDFQCIGSRPLRHATASPICGPQYSAISRLVHQIYSLRHYTTSTDSGFAHDTRRSRTSDPPETWGASMFGVPGNERSIQGVTQTWLKPIFREAWLNPRYREKARRKAAASFQNKVIPLAIIYKPRQRPSRQVSTRPWPIDSWMYLSTILLFPYDRKATQEELGKLPTLEWIQELVDWITHILEEENPNRSKERFVKDKLTKWLWPSFLTWILINKPDRALAFLQALTMEDPYPPAFAIADALHYLSIVARREFKGPGSVWASFPKLCLDILERRPDCRRCIPQDLVFNLLVASDTHEIENIYRKVVSWNLDWNIWTLMRFASAFGEAGNHELALDAFERSWKAFYQAHREEPKKTLPNFIHTAALILRRSATHGEGPEASYTILERLLTMGLPPKANALLYNIVMLNFVEADQFDTALRVFALFKQQGIEPHPYTYSIILKGCKLAEDITVHYELATQCAQKALEIRSAWVAADYLHYVLLYNERNLIDNGFKILATIYRKFFDPKPLSDLGIMIPDNDHPAEDSARLETTSSALALMIVAYIKEQKDHDLGHIQTLYARYRRLVETGHPDFAPLAEQTYVSNVFLLAFASHPNWLNQCTVVLGDMVKPLPETAVVAAEGRRVEQAQPDVISFSIVLNGFLLWKQTAAADKILDVMKQRGVEPNQATWGTIINGYARLQDVGRVAEAVKSMDQNGIEMDRYILAGLNRLNDRESLIKALSKPGPAA